MCDYQSRIWTGRGGASEMSSFVECVERLYDDSGLELALDAHEPVFGAAIDDEWRKFGNAVLTRPSLVWIWLRRRGRSHASRRTFPGQ
jgi:hypothetical protein